MDKSLHTNINCGDMSPQLMFVQGFIQWYVFKILYELNIIKSLTFYCTLDIAHVSVSNYSKNNNLMFLMHQHIYVNEVVIVLVH